MEDYVQTHIVDFKGAIEAVLFAYGDPIPIPKLAEILGIDKAACREQLNALSESYEKVNRGIRLLYLDDSVQLCSKDEFSEEIKKAVRTKKDSPLTPVTMEVLSIIAYNQPVTKGFIEQVRGVNSNQIVNNLVEKGLVEEAGRMDVPGKPIAYRTTKDFLRAFDMTSLENLPPLDQAQHG